MSVKWAFKNDWWSAPVPLDSSCTQTGGVWVHAMSSASSYYFLRNTFEMWSFQRYSCNTSVRPKAMPWKDISVISVIAFGSKALWSHIGASGAPAWCVLRLVRYDTNADSENDLTINDGDDSQVSIFTSKDECRTTVCSDRCEWLTRLHSRTGRTRILVFVLTPGVCRARPFVFWLKENERGCVCVPFYYASSWYKYYFINTFKYSWVFELIRTSIVTDAYRQKRRYLTPETRENSGDLYIIQTFSCTVSYCKMVSAATPWKHLELPYNFFWVFICNYSFGFDWMELQNFSETWCEEK